MRAFSIACVESDYRTSVSPRVLYVVLFLCCVLARQMQLARRTINLDRFTSLLLWPSRGEVYCFSLLFLVLRCGAFTSLTGWLDGRGSCSPRLDMPCVRASGTAFRPTNSIPVCAPLRIHSTLVCLQTAKLHRLLQTCCCQFSALTNTSYHKTESCSDLFIFLLFFLNSSTKIIQLQLPEARLRACNAPAIQREFVKS